MKRLPLILLLGSLSFSTLATNIEVYDFDSPAQERTYKELTTELRCLVCQNQDIADSNAELAQDMRHKVFRMLKNGKSKQEIIDFMVERYGDFVRYKPPFKGKTLVLWVGPFVIFVLAVIFMLRAIRRARQQEERRELSAEQIAQAADLLEQPSDKSTD
ncbi:cytochrome c-type biogenesis protein [endosymbiont of unidentified scaly snail isolate Monju]|uniref:cytochrome c-type biogenesis protein n=1 Tax=endosymbiont of unidentified scaly snail isolate Monju TaxID=1248727 RepID=UPI0003892A89|nr:cytochrome c-type biogenesis protein [endosymbiont of unidentified scaly snail isolate Monju]BAN68315.1 cytochrome c-type biogenesis protein CcmH [endosymbiont of unidentified scaly snail isolate Monju]